MAVEPLPEDWQALQTDSAEEGSIREYNRAREEVGTSSQRVTASAVERNANDVEAQSEASTSGDLNVLSQFVMRATDQSDH